MAKRISKIKNLERTIRRVTLDALDKQKTILRKSMRQARNAMSFDAVIFDDINQWKR